MSPMKTRSTTQRGAEKSAEDDQPRPSRGRKRKSDETEKNDNPRSPERQRPAKKAKIEPADVEDEKPIPINRAPVLELWGASVAHFLHPELSWATCLSIGSSISSITAISKGRSIGTISKSDPEEREKKRKRRTKDEDSDETREIKVMGFPIMLKGENVIFKEKAKPGKEDSLVRRFSGEKNLQKTKTVMQDALKEKWKGREADLEKTAFSLYEQFRPEVAGGQRGWGKKGALFLSKIEQVIKER
ncbi:hypothetical protein B0H63DRAFT_459649 [Podospora didyma]|uniref:Uncharacterized protein n=1 Tax=Podospora didyma TaxID=330526 RepID=A0AAE0P602_9PEZI|nr:hypothetical protein B0H63DRAFT_459649 [Podospora didyma]